MEDKLLNDILELKAKPIRDLLSLTESPIERIFLLEFLKYLDNSLHNMDIYCNGPITIIDGYTYIKEAIDDYGIKFNNNTIGLNINHTSSWFSADVSIPGVSKSKLNSTTRRSLKKISLSPTHFVYHQSVRFYPQHIVKIDFKTYRLDFAFLLYEEDNNCSAIRRKVGIECDGYEFHSKPDQFKKDRERIRQLQSDDWSILQYSGSEINSSSFDFAKEFDKIFSILGFSHHGVIDDE